MRIKEIHSHLGGHECLLVRRKAVWNELEAIVVRTEATPFCPKATERDGLNGMARWEAAQIRRAMGHRFIAAGWKQARAPSLRCNNSGSLLPPSHGAKSRQQEAEIEKAGLKPIASYNQTDFVKRRVAVEVQFGKYSFIAYDLFIKHLAFYIGDVIDVGVEILPMKSMQAEMSSGPGYYEFALYGIARQGRGVPAVPLVLVGVVP